MNKTFIGAVSAAVLLTTTAGIAATGAYSETSAAPGSYTSSASSASTVPTPMAAEKNGFYVLGALGYGETNLDNSTFKQDGKVVNTKDGFTWDLGLGYQFNQNLGVELGYLNLPNVKWNSDAPRGDTGNMIKDSYDITLMAKGTFPINNQFNVFGAAGIADAHYNVPNAVIDMVVSNKVLLDQGSTNKIVPALALGVGYNVNANVGVVGKMQWAKDSGNYPGSLVGLVALNYFIG